MSASPCIGLCEVEDGKCTGCGRTIEEIAQWTNMSDSEKLEVIARLSEDG